MAHFDIVVGQDGKKTLSYRWPGLTILPDPFAIMTGAGRASAGERVEVWPDAGVVRQYVDGAERSVLIRVAKAAQGQASRGVVGLGGQVGGVWQGVAALGMSSAVPVSRLGQVQPAAAGMPGQAAGDARSRCRLGSQPQPVIPRLTAG